MLVNNAGHQSWTPDGALAITDEQWRTDLDTNLMSAIRLDRALLPAMITQGHGAIVHITSEQARLPVAGSALPYAVAKAGLTLYSKGLASETGRHGIRVNAVAPALIETEGTAEITQLRRQQTNRLGAPLQKIGQPRDVAALVAFLASPAAGFITGSQYTIDGGVTPAV